MHRWSGWPGAYCLDCGTEEVVQYALACNACHVQLGEDEQPTKLCPEHEEWATLNESGCPPVGK